MVCCFTNSAVVTGIEAHCIKVEAAIAEGNAAYGVINIVGLPDAAVRESRDRVVSAIKNSEFSRTSSSVVINLAPADLRKEGAGFDLPIALSLLALENTQIKQDVLQKIMVVGELGLSGEVRPVPGVLNIAIKARKEGIKVLIVPIENAREAGIVKGLNVYGVGTLRELVAWLQGKNALRRCQTSWEALTGDQLPEDIGDYRDVKGQELAKRALEVAAAGGHNLLMIGPPGTGKSMLAQRFPSILPPLELDEAIETSRIHSVAGLLDANRPLITQRPFRAPHHTVSDAGLLGGQNPPHPGEVSLAHHGVLFLDELPEFKRRTLEVLRQPLEDGQVTISRAGASYTFPAAFQLLAAMNPCPCGYEGSRRRRCRCSGGVKERYRSRLSGPLLDRIDIHVEVPELASREMLDLPTGKSSAQMREAVLKARAVQLDRFAGSKTFFNGKMTPAQIEKYCRLDEGTRNFLLQAMETLHLSPRAFGRILKVARTIADMELSETIQRDHIREAIQYRSLDRTLW
ncbi:MAG: ATP-binding protein [Lentisphaerae bacterium]|nr:MAG: ATP-binding protein [Lentisphaerota bacterium]